MMLTARFDQTEGCSEKPAAQLPTVYETHQGGEVKYCLCIRCQCSFHREVCSAVGLWLEFLMLTSDFALHL